MTYIDKKLLKAAKEGNKFINEVGDTSRGIYLGYDMKKDEKFNKIRYHFKFQTADGAIKELRCNAKKFLIKMASIQVGSKLEVTKTGEGMETDYDIEVISKPKQAAQVEDEDGAEEETEEEEAPVKKKKKVVEEDEDEEEDGDEDPTKAKF